VRDLATIASGRLAATTVASTRTWRPRGIAVFATGGLGGVHRHARESWDESADLYTLCGRRSSSSARREVDPGRTGDLERLETLNVGVLGYRTDRFPGSTWPTPGIPSTGGSTHAEVAAVLGPDRTGHHIYGLLLANPIRPPTIDADLHERVLASRSRRRRRWSSRQGRHAVPARPLPRETHGASLTANVALVRRTPASPRDRRPARRARLRARR